MTIKLYNTLSRSKEEFSPIKHGELSMYDCGPTVYDYAHIGNLRSYVMSDLIRRTFEYNGYPVKQIINITDVGHLSSDADEGEDKMTKALKRDGKPMTLEAMKEVGTFYFERFVDDLKRMNIELPEKFPRASDTVSDDIELIRILEEKGFAYKAGDGMYFDTAKFPDYGKLGNIRIDAQKEGARVSVNSEKRNPADFALWKFDAKLGWESPWGMGFPGWHIECSAMSRKYLGQPFDIHTGGIDHIPVHHNNEIAQSEAAYGVPLANYWMHNAFITVASGKMAKSEGNFMTLNSLLEEAVSPLAYRYWLLTAHYRSPVNFTYDAVKSAQTALIRLMATVSAYPEGGAVIPAYMERFRSYINDDIDTPMAVALTWDLIKDKKQSDADKRATIIDFDRVFGLNLSSVPKVQEETVPPEIAVLADAREEARKEKDWAKADALRAEIEARGFQVLDSEGGFTIRAL